MDGINAKIKPSFFFVGQYQHLLLLLGLIPGAVFLAGDALEFGRWMGVSTAAWFYALLLIVVLHQVIGWFVFRSQLCFSLLTRLFGKYDLLVWGIIFFPFLLLRPLLNLAIGLADYGSIPQLRWLQILVGLLLMIPVIYTLWSIKKYFGIGRALGGDHFRQRYREMPLVREGAFRYSSNAMYTFVFLSFFAIGLFTGSRAALAAAVFQCAYIWVHMYCTEEPDMGAIFG